MNLLEILKNSPKSLKSPSPLSSTVKANSKTNLNSPPLTLSLEDLSPERIDATVYYEGISFEEHPCIISFANDKLATLNLDLTLEISQQPIFNTYAKAFPALDPKLLHCNVISHLNQTELQFLEGRHLIACSSKYIVYAVKECKIRVLCRSSGFKMLLKDHSDKNARILDIRCSPNDPSLFASLTSNGSLFIWKILEKDNHVVLASYSIWNSGSAEVGRMEFLCTPDDYELLIISGPNGVYCCSSPFEEAETLKTFHNGIETDALCFINESSIAVCSERDQPFSLNVISLLDNQINYSKTIYFKINQLFSYCDLTLPLTNYLFYSHSFGNVIEICISDFSTHSTLMANINLSSVNSSQNESITSTSYSIFEVDFLNRFIIISSFAKRCLILCHFVIESGRLFFDSICSIPLKQPILSMTIDSVEHGSIQLMVVQTKSITHLTIDLSIITRDRVQTQLSQSTKNEHSNTYNESKVDNINQINTSSGTIEYIHVVSEMKSELKELFKEQETKMRLQYIDFEKAEKERTLQLLKLLKEVLNNNTTKTFESIINNALNNSLPKIIQPMIKSEIQIAFEKIRQKIPTLNASQLNIALIESMKSSLQDCLIPGIEKASIEMLKQVSDALDSLLGESAKDPSVIYSVVFKAVSDAMESSNQASNYYETNEGDEKLSLSTTPKRSPSVLQITKNAIKDCLDKEDFENAFEIALMKSKDPRFIMEIVQETSLIPKIFSDNGSDDSNVKISQQVILALLNFFSKKLSNLVKGEGNILNNDGSLPDSSLIDIILEWIRECLLSLQKQSHVFEQFGTATCNSVAESLNLLLDSKLKPHHSKDIKLLLKICTSMLK